MNDVRIHVICYNEEKILPFFIRQYSKRFPGCNITVYNNESTDGTATLAILLCCDVVNFSTQNQMCDSVLRDIRNNCWKGQKEKWAIVVDADEIITATSENLSDNFNVWKFNGVQMIGEGEPIEQIKYGVRDDVYSKAVLFNTFEISEMNYSVGSHICNPIAKDFNKIRYNERVEALLHYKWVDFESVIVKHNHYAERLSDENKLNGWSSHYAEQYLQQRNHYNDLLSKKTRIL